MILAIIGYLFIVAAVIQLGRDVFYSMNTSSFKIETFGELWFNVSAGSLNLLQAVIERYIWPSLWDPGIVFILKIPAFVLLFVIAFICLLFSQRQA